VKQQGAATLREEAHAVSDPTSERYGDFLSFEQVVQLQRPTSDHLVAVHKHLDELGAHNRTVTAAGDKIVVKLKDISVVSAEALPANVAAALDGVTSSVGSGLLRRDLPMRNRPAAFAPALGDSSLPSCFSDFSISAMCIRSLYGVDTLSAASHPDNLQTVVVNEDFNATDLKYYLQQQGLPDQEIVKLVNGEIGGRAQTEASLDTQFITAFGSGTPTWWFYIDGNSENPFDAWLTYMSNTSTIPLVHSLSVGAPEDEVGNTLVARMNDEMAALGSRGSTIVFASGDSGYTKTQKFGAGSPFVTAVGGVWNGELGGDNYISVDDISTGGFSSLAANAAPSYQKQAVSHYLTTSGTRPSSLDSSKRCVPDLALFDNGVDVRVNGRDVYTGGTSAAAPMLSGMLSLINDALLHANLSPLGFVNPLLYANADAFQDITQGDNNGFAAVEGYDPASGLGTFDSKTLTKLMNAALSAKQAASKKRASRTRAIVV